MSKYIKPCRVCGKETAYMVQGSNFYNEFYRKGYKALFDNCCPECKTIYSNDVRKYASLRILLAYFKITRSEWQLQGCE